MVHDETVDALVEIGNEVFGEIRAIRDDPEWLPERLEWLETLAVRWTEVTLQVITDRHKGEP